MRRKVSNTEADGNVIDHRLRIALACSGLGEIRRGYERHFAELYRLIHTEFETVLFKGGAAGPGVQLFRPSRKARLAAFVGKLTGRSATDVEVLCFASWLIPAAVAGRFDLVHFANAQVIPYARLPRGVLRPNLLFTNGGGYGPKNYSEVDFVHLLTPFDYQRAIEFGMPKERLFTIPIGVDTKRFQPVSSDAKLALRSKYGIPDDSFVVVGVGDLGQGSFKRAGWLIDEVARLSSKVFLLLVGHRDKTSAVYTRLCEVKLGNRFRIMTMPDEEVHEAYAVADLMALASLRETFPNVFVEAMSTAIPVIAHDHPAMRWIVADGGSIIDMTAPGELASEIQFYVDNPDLRRERGERGRTNIMEKFDYDALKPAYLNMYRRCAADT